MRKFVKSVSAAILVVSLLLCVIIGFYYVSLPDKYYLSENATFRIDTFFDISGGKTASDTKQVYAPTDVLAENEIDLCLFGMFPIKRVEAQQIERPLLIPCGMPFGIKILTEGAIVTEFGTVDNGENGFVAPARDGGIIVGDVIIEVNGIIVQSNDDVATAVQANPHETTVVLVRDGTEQTVSITPVRSAQDGVYKIGMWVRDSSAGIGTMTFYNPETLAFGGLGHGICDVDTGQIMPFSSGEAVPVYISGVIKGHPGVPGELNGTFLSHSTLGTLTANTEAGIFGVMEKYSQPENSEDLTAIEMAYKQEVTVGPATIRTTVDGDTPVEYDVMIEKIDYSDKNQVKNMVIRITDRELLRKTGGIVQGMSGSPIIQDGRLIGAVTHVFVSDPSRGYAIFAENMYRQLDAQTEQALNKIVGFVRTRCREYDEYYLDAA
jgi:stage IV sporulation protein B